MKIKWSFALLNNSGRSLTVFIANYVQDYAFLTPYILFNKL